jgi:hypothetical protein
MTTPNIQQKTKIIVSFSGSGMIPLQIPRKEFVKTLDRLFPNYKKLFLVDKDGTFYHHGVYGISKDIESTVEYLQDQIRNFDEAIFLGSSAGGYASILFGSMLKIAKVIAFIPQTNINGYSSKTKYEYENINKFINNCTQYYLFGNPNEEYDSMHGKIHLDNVSGHNNVFIKMIENLHLKNMRNSGELDKILQEIIQS